MQNISFYESGNGFPLVFIHGFCETNDIWDSLNKELSDEFRIVCPDLPGFGRSPLPNNHFSLEEIGDTIIEWLRDIGIHQCIVIGHSLGGYISLEILRKYPEMIKAIGLFNSSAFEDKVDKKEIRNKLIEFIKSHGVEPFLKTFVPSLFYLETADAHTNIIAGLSEKGLSTPSDSVIKYAAAMRDRADSMDLLKTYHDRILLIAGEFDQNVPLKKSKAMAKILDKRNAHFIPESAHMSLFEQSDMCYEIIREFAHRISDPLT